MDDTKDTKDIKETGEAASVLSADEQMIQDGFNALLNDYLKSNHRRKVERITKAFNFANQAHAGVKRRSGEPYIMHPIAVARIVCREMGLGSTSICSALLHDVVEDTEYTVEDIRDMFGDKIAQIVDGLTKISGGIFGEQASAQAENFRKLLLTMSDDIRVILIKIADRLHNMRTLGSMLPAKQFKIAGETLYLYAPLAHRLGLFSIKTELEDLSFKYEHPQEYDFISAKLKATEESRNKLFERFAAPVDEKLKSMGLQYEMRARVKSVYSIWNKMESKGVAFEDIYDIYAVRIIFDPLPGVDEKNQCWDIYSAITDIYRIRPDRIRDWVSRPKANGYQALHLTVMGPDGQWVEIQIRSRRMDDIAEKGFAAHWKYKENITGEGDNEEQKISWLRQILEWQRDLSDNHEFLNLLKDDLNMFSENVYCFTPNGDLKSLPNGSTPIDFAYSIHSAVGNKMVGARVNGKMVNIDYKIQNGDQVEVVTSNNSNGPSMDWLKIVKSTQAKNKINQWFKLQNKEENIIKGKELIDKYCKSKGIVLQDILKPEYMEKVRLKYSYKDWNSLVASVGHGGLKEGQIVNKLVEEYNKTHRKEITDQDVLNSTIGEKAENKTHTSKSGIIVEGMDDVAVRFSKCCSPVPGDEIIGFVTRGRGVSIHRTDCINIINLPDFERGRLIEASWAADEGKQDGKYMTEIVIYAHNRVGILTDLSKIFTEKNIDVNSINSRTSKSEIATISMSFAIQGTEELNSLISRIRQIDSIIDIERTTG